MFVADNDECWFSKMSNSKLYFGQMQMWNKEIWMIYSNPTLY